MQEMAGRVGLWMMLFSLMGAVACGEGDDDDASMPDDQTSMPGDDDVTSPPGDDDTTTPGDDDTSPTGDDDTTTPGDDDTTTPGDDDTTSPPGDDDSTSPGVTTPPGDDDVTTSPGDDDTTSPGDDDTTIPPGDDDVTTAPGDDDTTIPPGDDDATAPGDDDATAPGDDDVTTAPGDETTPPGDDDATVDDTTPPTAWTFEDCSDQSRDFWAWDLSVMPPRSVIVPATCRLIGPNAYLYVADDQWDVNVDDEMAYDFMVTFEYQASPDARLPDAGIFDNDAAVFGDIPDALDNDPRMYVLLLNIADYVNDEGEVFSFDGYFNAYDELTDEQAQRQTFGLYHSNECEMLYLNARIRPVTDPYTLGVAAHELQHLIHYNYDTAEEVWMSESLAEIAMLVSGFYTDIGWVESYASDPSSPLVTSTASGSYGAYLLWGMYLFEQTDADFMIPLETEQQDGITGLNRALRAAGFDTDFETLYGDWVVANTLNDRSVDDGRYGYAFTEALPEMATVAGFMGSGGSYEGEVVAFGVDYLELTALNAGATLTLTSSAANSLLVRLITIEADGAATVSTLTSRQGVRTVKLDGGPDREYRLVVTNTDTAEIDSGNAVGYAVKVSG